MTKWRVSRISTQRAIHVHPYHSGILFVIFILSA